MTSFLHVFWTHQIFSVDVNARVPCIQHSPMSEPRWLLFAQRRAKQCFHSENSASMSDRVAKDEFWMFEFETQRWQTYDTLVFQSCAVSKSSCLILLARRFAAKQEHFAGAWFATHITAMPWKTVVSFSVHLRRARLVLGPALRRKNNFDAAQLHTVSGVLFTMSCRSHLAYIYMI